MFDLKYAQQVGDYIYYKNFITKYFDVLDSIDQIIKIVKLNFPTESNLKLLSIPITTKKLNIIVIYKPSPYKYTYIIFFIDILNYKDI